MSRPAKKISGRAKNIPARDTILLPYQKRWVEDRARLKAAEKSRQIGWTWATAYDLVRQKSQKDARLDSWITSRDELQAKLFIEDLKNWSTVLEAGARDLGERAIDEKGGTAYTLQFANGLCAYSLSSNADAQAGKRGDRVLDEFALNKDPRHLYGIAYPGITWGGQLAIFSTHRGTANYFNELVTEIKHKGNPKKFSLHSVTLQTALEQGFLHKLQQKLLPEDERQGMDEAEYFDFIRAGCPDAETFQQEYMCLPSDDNSAFLSYDLIAGCEYKPEEDWKIPPPQHWTDLLRTRFENSALYIGVDIGRDHDLTVIWVTEKVGDVHFTRAVEAMARETFDAQEAVLYDWLQLPQVRRCCIDQTGMGRQFAERAQKRFGEYRVEGVTFTGPVKEELAYPVRAAFEDRSVRVPNDPLVRADLRAIKKDTTASGNIRFTADRGKNGHADRFWGLALAIHAGKNPPEGLSSTAGIRMGGNGARKFVFKPRRLQIA